MIKAENEDIYFHQYLILFLKGGNLYNLYIIDLFSIHYKGHFHQK